MHPHCRSTIVGSLKGDGKPKGTRAARDESGKYIRVPADMTYAEWYNKYIRPWNVPTGNGNWATDKQGRVIITKRIPKDTRNFRTVTHAAPNSVIMHYGKPGPHEQMDYDLYDENGYLAMQIHCGNHAMPKHHKFGEFGEHAVHWVWVEKSGKWSGHPSKNRELTEKERRMVHNGLEFKRAQRRNGGLDGL